MMIYIQGKSSVSCIHERYQHSCSAISMIVQDVSDTEMIFHFHFKSTSSSRSWTQKMKRKSAEERVYFVTSRKTKKQKTSPLEWHPQFELRAVDSLK